ncbi:MAG: GrpB family protein [Thermomicrobiales bacterium]|nr:GrpB family protein [Thermomicrobiales bacterium]
MSTFDPFSTNADRSTPINTPTPIHGQIVLVEYDPVWPEMYEAEAAHVRAALGEKAIVLEHIGSTSVPGLIAKPCIDMLLGVTDSADEDAYVPALEQHGFVLRLRHPEWNEHRAFKSERINVNLHVWSADSPEVARHINFRDWLRTHDDDRQLYAETKRVLAAQDFETMSDYANAKDDVVRQIQARIDAAAVR